MCRGYAGQRCGGATGPATTLCRCAASPRRASGCGSWLSPLKMSHTVRSSSEDASRPTRTSQTSCGHLSMCAGFAVFWPNSNAATSRKGTRMGRCFPVECAQIIGNLTPNLGRQRSVYQRVTDFPAQARIRRRRRRRIPPLSPPKLSISINTGRRAAGPTSRPISQQAEGRNDRPRRRAPAG